VSRPGRGDRGPARRGALDRRGGRPAAPVATRSSRGTGGTRGAGGTAPRSRAGRPSSGYPAARPTAVPARRLVALLAVLLVAFAAVGARLVQVQLMGDGRYEAFGASQRIRSIALPADRGSIFDRNGNDLAISIPQRTIWADPRLIADPAGAATALVPVLGPVTGMDVPALEARLAAPGAFTYLARRVSDDVADRVEAMALPGIFLLDEPKRFAPAGGLGRSLLGQVGIDNEGLSGLERQYDELLTGVPGELVVERAPGGRTIPAGERQLEPAQRGDDLVLTIDRSLQYETERALADQVAAKGAKGGIAVVTRPATGEILAMANVVTDPETGEVVNTGNNMALTTVFEPGSVNKVITLAAALEEGLVTPETVLEVPYTLTLGGYPFRDHDPHPTEGWSVTKILSKSSNIGTIKIAQMLGKDRVDAYLRSFGFGTATGTGFPNESAGILLPPERWSGSSIGAIPIGQGIAVTAMQMLSAYNVLANDGVHVPPRLVLETVDARGVRQPVEPGEPRRIVSSTTAGQMREMLVNVVTEGTGQRGGIQGYAVAGKTGTARKPQPGGGYEDEHGRFRYVATFTGFVPAERPELSIIVAIDEPSGDIYGGSVAAPVFADLAQYALRMLKIPPVLVERAPAPDTAAALAVEEGRVDPGAAGVGGDRDASGERARVRAAPAAAPDRASPEHGGE
jgi:cell division protein FtsI (penicillin-binding protein 3)